MRNFQARILPFMWIIFISIFLLAGIVGRDPWKQDETYSFGIIYHFYMSHTWIVPTNAGEAFMEKPPLYYWTAVLFMKVFSVVLPLHDAARLASVFYTLIASLFTWKTATQLLEKYYPVKQKMGWIACSLLLATLGFIRHSHDLFTDVALIAGSSMALYGLSIVLTKNEAWKKAALYFGLGVGISFLSKGLLMPVIFGLSTLLLLIVLPAFCRANFLRTLLLSFLIASPFLFIWPTFLYFHSYDFFMQWYWDNNVGRFLGFSVGRLGADNKPLFILYSAFWFAFPVFPLALLELWRSRKQWRSPKYLLPTVVSLTGIGVLLSAASGRSLYLLPLLPAFTLLATQALVEINTQFLFYWNRILRVLFLIMILGIWLVWLSLQKTHPIAFILPLLSHAFVLDFVPQGHQYLAIFSAAVASLFFIRSLSLNGRSAVNTASIYFVGMATMWILANTLLLPWINEAKSYRSVLEQMQASIKDFPKGQCINTYCLGESIALCGNILVQGIKSIGSIALLKSIARYFLL